MSKPLCVILLSALLIPPMTLAADSPSPPQVDLYGDPLPMGALARLGTIRYRHHGDRSIIRVHFTDDSLELVTIRGNKVVWMQVTNGLTSKTVSLPSNEHRLLAISPNLTRAVSALLTFDEEREDDFVFITVTDLVTGEHRQLGSWRFRGNFGLPQGAAFTPDSRVIALDTRPGIRMLDTKTGEIVQDCVTGANVEERSIVFSSDGETIYASTSNGDPFTGRWEKDPILGIIPCPKGEASVVAVSPDDQLLVAAGNSIIRVWDTATQEELRTIDVGEEVRIGASQLAFTADSRAVVVPVYAERFLNREPQGQSGIQYWDLIEKKLIHHFPQPSSSVAISPDGQWLASAGGGTFIRIWDLQTREPVGLEYEGHDSHVRTCEFTADGSQIVSPTVFGDVLIWDAKSGRLLDRLQHSTTAAIRKLATSPDGKYIASSGFDGTVKVWDASTHQLVYTLDGHGQLGSDGALQFGQDGEYLYSWGDNHQMKVFDLKTSETLRDFSTKPVADESKPDNSPELLSDPGSISMGAFTPDSRLLLVTQSGQMRRFDVAAQEEYPAILIQHAFPNLGLTTPDSKFHLMIAKKKNHNRRRGSKSSKEYTVFVYDLSTGELARSFDLIEGKALRYALSPDGQYLAVNQGSLNVYKFDSGKLIAKIPMETPIEWTIRFSPDGQTIATVHQNSNILIWDWPAFRTKNSHE